MFMAMYMFHIAFALGLIALMMGLCMWKGCCKSSCNTNSEKCGSCGKWAGLIITLLALISLACLVHSGYKHMQMKGGMKDMLGMELEKLKEMKEDMKDDMKDMKKDMDNKD